MSRPRLLVLASTWPGRADDGTPSFVRDLAVEEGAEFDVLALVPAVPGGRAVERDGPVTVHRYRYFPRAFEDLAHGAILENLRKRPSRWLQLPSLLIAQFIATRRAVRSFRPDVLHVHWIVPQGIIAVLAAPGVPKLLTSPGGDIYALDLAPVRWLKRRALLDADRVTVMNRDMADRAAALGAPRERVSVLPMGTRRPGVAAVPLAMEAGTSDPSPRGDAPPTRIFFVGRLVEKKGVQILLAALRSLPPERSWELRIGGDGPLRAELTAAAAGLPVTFLGQLDRTALAVEFRAAGLVVFPSVLASSGDQDGLPVALLDALAAGVAIVASALPGLDEAVVDGVSGVLVPSGDTAALADAITRLLGDGELRARLARGALDRASDYTIEGAGDRYRALMLDILSERASTAQ
ncbi:glycosyltransferase family 4 protein [Plantibacter sp. CFBP 13570]|uniref:glycosyltransferase family 4 protein n=1 Tax=Plantibacter sp. CFBP 13570 TaxID=2775272 RepID=UPI001930C43B|nr:glycosyltransferase family 4 protein [Plantibacter sp. CFBP 13570]MBD8533849.1 glycosyltransferase family 4 protein [Plantibacter sp. CFBP 13570]